MRKLRLLSTVAAAVLIAGSVAMAQTTAPGGKNEGAAPAPAAQQNAPAEKMAPTMKRGEQKAGAEHKPRETTGQAPKASDADTPRATDKGDLDKSMEKGPAGKSSSDMKHSPESDVKGGANVKSKTNESAQAPVGEKSGATTGQGAVSSTAKLSTEQRSKITTIIRQHKVEPAHINVSVSVGTRIPESVHFYPLPVEVVAIYPEWRGYDYILVGDQIVVIDPRTHEIVAILEA
ncbi:MAG TPA: DUF1236 domain-containing protein [Pseudolabrys sp.]|jgi:hypothetical protein